MTRRLLFFVTACLILLDIDYVNSVTSNNLHTERLKILKSKGFCPRVVYDIGAYRGSWTNEIHKVFNEAQFYLFEANEIHQSQLEKLPFPFFINVLSDRKESAIFYSNNSTGDSLLREQTKFYDDRNCEKKIVNTTTLEALVLEHDLPLPDLIKMDVQGAEKLIIQGSPSIICHAKVIVLEIKILEYNKNAPLLYDMITLMHELGYRALDILEWHYLPTQELNEIDILFVKNDSSLIKTGILW